MMQKRYNGKDYLFALLVTFGCAFFILYPASADINPYNKGRESTVWGISLMMGYLGFDGFTSTFQDKLFKGYDMEIHNQIFYTTLCSCILSLSGLVLHGHLLSAIEFMFRHQDCFYDVVLLSTVATASQFFISYTIRTFGALTFATIMTMRQDINGTVASVTSKQGLHASTADQGHCIPNSAAANLDGKNLEIAEAFEISCPIVNT